MALNLRDQVRLANIKHFLDLFMKEFDRVHHNASLLRYDKPWTWDELADKAPMLASAIQSAIEREIPDSAPIPDELFFYGRQGATLSTDCYWTMTTGTWADIDIAAEFDLPLCEEDLKDYGCRSFEEAKGFIEGHYLVLKAINDKVREAVYEFSIVLSAEPAGKAAACAGG